MKKLMSVLLIAAMITAVLAGCGREPRVLYNGKLSKYITLGEYKGIKVDTKSDKFKEFYDGIIAEDVQTNDLYVQKTEGAVADGDSTYIDYEGKKDGVPFEGGTGQNYNLVIGSGSFIPGFEDQLIGKEIGSTVDIDVTFPADYQQSPDLAGQPVVFTVTIHYVKTDEPMKPEDYYQTLDYDLLKAYTDNVTERAVKNFLMNAAETKAEIKEYPEEDIETLYTAHKNMIVQYYSQYIQTFEEYLQQTGESEADFKKEALEKQIKPQMKSQMTAYAIFDKEKMTVTEKDIKARATKLAKTYGEDVAAKDVLDYFGESYFEALFVQEKVVDLLYETAKIK